MNRELDRGPRYMIISLTHFLLAALFLTIAVTNSAVAQSAPPQSTPQGLQLVPESEFGVAYVRPNTDFSVYNKIIILEAEVAFKSTWRSQHRLADYGDMSRIRRELAALLREVFIEELQGEGGYEIVEEAGEDVLVIRPAIVDLDVEAPFTGSAGSYSFTASAGSATLTLDLFDSVSGAVLAQAADRQVARHRQGAGTGALNFQRATRVSNRLDAERVLRSWAEILRERLDEVHG